MKKIAVAEYPIRYDGHVLRAPYDEIESVEFSNLRPTEETPSQLIITVTFKPGSPGAQWQIEK